MVKPGSSLSARTHPAKVDATCCHHCCLHMQGQAYAHDLLICFMQLQRHLQRCTMHSTSAALDAKVHSIYSAWHHSNHVLSGSCMAPVWHLLQSFTGMHLQSEHWSLMINLISFADVTGAGGAAHCTMMKAYLRTSRAPRVSAECPRPPGLWTARHSRKPRLQA